MGPRARLLPLPSPGVGPILARKARGAGNGGLEQLTCLLEEEEEEGTGDMASLYEGPTVVVLGPVTRGWSGKGAPSLACYMALYPQLDRSDID